MKYCAPLSLSVSLLLSRRWILHQIFTPLSGSFLNGKTDANDSSIVHPLKTSSFSYSSAALLPLNFLFFFSFFFFRCEIPYSVSTPGPMSGHLKIIFQRAFFTQREFKSGTMVSTDFPSPKENGKKVKENKY